MKHKIVLASMAAWALSALTAMACIIEGTVTCPNGSTDKKIKVYLVGGGWTFTNPKGFYQLDGSLGLNTVCVDPKSLSKNFVIDGPACIDVDADANDVAIANFTLTGPGCGQTPPQGLCWLTGGGTIGGEQGTPDFTYGGVVNPGCSPDAAGGGNWNVLDHVNSLHFMGQSISVDGCSGDPDRSPPVNVNIIDFSGTGVCGTLGSETSPVTFKARAIDRGEPGSGVDELWLEVTDVASGNVVILISGNTDPTVVSPVPISTGNLQIHTSSCGK